MERTMEYRRPKIMAGIMATGSGADVRPRGVDAIIARSRIEQVRSRNLNTPERLRRTVAVGSSGGARAERPAVSSKQLTIGSGYAERRDLSPPPMQLGDQPG